MSYVRGVSLELPGVTLHDQIVTAIPLDDLEGPLGHPIDGILGYDFLSRFVVELDYPHATMTLYDRALGRRPAGEPVPITLTGLVPNASATIEIAGHQVTDWFVVDTGCNCEVQFNAPFTRAHRLIEATPKLVGNRSRGAGGESPEVTGRLPALSIQGLRMPSVLAAFSRDTVGGGADPDSAGLLGGGLWKRFVVTFDYDRKTMWLARTAGFDRPTPMVGAGILWGPSGDGFTLRVVRDQSAGAEAGLAVGDVLISIDGAPAAAYTLDQLQAMFAQQGVTHAVVVRRGAEQRDTRVTPREQL
jgi:hypothetical protein